MNKFDVLVLGGGPGGYVAAIRASQLGKSVAVIEKDSLGGICLNWGCIPTKSLLKDSEVLHLIKNASQYGIDIKDYSVNFDKTIKRSRSVSKRLSKGIEYLLKKNKIKHIAGSGVIKSTNSIEVITNDGNSELYECQNIIIATGARNKVFPGLETDGKSVISSKEAMVLEEIPKSMTIIGAGAIGVEFASFFSEYGTEVNLIEMQSKLLPLEDYEISSILKKSFESRGINIHLSTKVEKIEKLKDGLKINLLDENNNSDQIKSDIALVAIGVQGNIENIGLEKIGIQIESGYIKTNEFYQTSVDNIYAIGDVIGPPWLAHVASAEGRVSAEHINKNNVTKIDYQNIPGCTYCRPQVASIGLTEDAAKKAGFSLKVGRFPLQASGKALAIGEPDGMVKVIFDEKYGELLGCHIIGSEATELIAEAGVVRTLETTQHEILNTIHAHPTISESFMEADADAYNEAIHI